jgi:hypothetical protein
MDDSNMYACVHTYTQIRERDLMFVRSLIFTFVCRHIDTVREVLAQTNRRSFFSYDRVLSVVELWLLSASDLILHQRNDVCFTVRGWKDRVSIVA